MQINIAICDDEMEICSQIEKIVIELLEEFSIKYEIDVFYSGENLCREMQRKEYELVFLDIQLPRMNGIEVGKYIREVINNQNVQIAYISSKQEYAMELFDYRPINFLVKPIDKEMIKKKVLDKYLVISKQSNHIFTYKKRFNFFKIPMSEILYFQNNNRKITVVTKNDSDEFYDSMDNVYSEVKRENFLYIHKSVIVNYHYIAKISYSEVTMIDKTVFSISQSRRTMIRDMYLKIKKGESRWI